ncbi:MAG TPA: hypothetical protein DCG32_07990, partial [Sphaerochaeta sp.]|nr:hypothetical protein [Sphaerochaeta sp.]
MRRKSFVCLPLSKNSSSPYVMKSPLPIQKAKEAALLLQEALDFHQALDFEGEKLISTDYLFGKARGQMFGILVCEDKEGNEVTLKAFSGQYDGAWLIPGWVGPVADPSSFDQIVRESNTLLHELTDKITWGKSVDSPMLVQQRKALSQSVLLELYSLYKFR